MQEKQGNDALELQKERSNADRDIKVVDLIMNSRSPALAQLKAELLSSLYKEENISAFLDLVKERTEMKQFPGDLGIEMRMKVFEKLVEKCKEPADIVLLARDTLFGGEGWFEKLVEANHPAERQGMNSDYTPG